MAKKKTYAQEAKSIMNRYKLRLGENFDKGDKMAEKAMEAELSSLRERQEADRTSLFPEETEQFANGGILPKYGGFNFSQFLNRPTPDFNVAPDTLPATSAEAMAAQTGSSPVANNVDSPFKSRVPIGGIIEGIGGLISNWGDVDLPTYEPTEFKPGRVATNLVDYSRGREQTMRERDLANAAISRGAAQGGSQSALMERLMAGRTSTQRTAGAAFNQSIEEQANKNAMIKNDASLKNAQLGLTAAQMNERNKLYANQLERENALINEQRRGNRIGSVTNALAGYLGDKGKAANYDQMVNMEIARNPNYGLVQDDPTWLRRLLGFTDPITEISYRNTKDKVSG